MADKKEAETSKPEPTAPATSAAPAATGSVAVPPKGKSNKKLFIIIGVVVFVLFILPGFLLLGALTWFSRGDHAQKATESLIEKSVESATGSKVDINTKDGSYTAKDKNGNEYSVGGDQNYADDFPSEVPKYPGGTVQSNIRTKSDSGIYWANTVETSDSVDKVNAFFKDKFSTWENEGEYSYNGTTTTSYKKSDLSVGITVTKSDSKTTISYTVTKDTTPAPTN